MVTKNADDDKAWVWESEIDSSSYSIREGEFILHLAIRTTMHACYYIRGVAVSSVTQSRFPYESHLSSPYSNTQSPPN